MIGKNKARIAVTLTKEEIQKIEDLAKNDKRSISSMAAILIERGLETYNKIF
ncbi:MAG: hypothetical protein WCR33_05480 [Bacilli bacterium]